MPSIFTICSDEDRNDVLTDYCVDNINNLKACLPHTTEKNGMTTEIKVLECVVLDDGNRFEVVYRSYAEVWIVIYYILELTLVTG